MHIVFDWLYVKILYVGHCTLIEYNWLSLDDLLLKLPFALPNLPFNYFKGFDMLKFFRWVIAEFAS